MTDGGTLWDFLSGGDGGDVAVDNVTLASTNFSIRYSSFQNLGSFRRSIWDSNNNFVSQTFPTLTVTSGSTFVPQFKTPFERRQSIRSGYSLSAQMASMSRSIRAAPSRRSAGRIPRVFFRMPWLMVGFEKEFPTRPFSMSESATTFEFERLLGAPFRMSILIRAARLTFATSLWIPMIG